MGNAELHYISGAVVNCAEKKENNVYSKVFSWVTSAARAPRTEINSGVRNVAKGRLHLQMKASWGSVVCI